METQENKLQIKQISFESNSNIVTLLGLLDFDKVLIESEFYINYSDLNKLINNVYKITNGEVDLINYFENINLTYDKSIHVLDTKNTVIENLWIENIDFLQGNFKICA